MLRKRLVIMFGLIQLRDCAAFTPSYNAINLLTSALAFIGSFYAVLVDMNCKQKMGIPRVIFDV